MEEQTAYLIGVPILSTQRLFEKSERRVDNIEECEKKDLYGTNLLDFLTPVSRKPSPQSKREFY
jgi:hypothetical protein